MSLATSHKGIRKYLKQRILSVTPSINHEKEEKQIQDLLRKTVEHAESNSLLLIGPRGAGKSMLIKRILDDVQSSPNFKNNCILVKLHGLIHTDDRLALKSITSQMSLDNAVDGKVFGSFAENLAFLLACLRSGEKRTSKSIIFILEEFDLFCSHHNQTLLYNLFDVSQSDQAPVCILGITCRLDVIQLLEKRVKSRFSHRQIFLFSGRGENSDESELDHALNKIKSYLSLPEKTTGKITKSNAKEWNSSLQLLLNNKKVKNVIQRLIDLDERENTLKYLLLQCIFRLNTGNQNLTMEVFQQELDALEKDDMVQVLQDLSVLELCLIIGMKHHCDIYDNQPMNFQMILTRYVKFANKHSSMQSIQRPVIMKAFEHIENLELISMISTGSSRVQKDYQFFKLLVTPQQISEAVSKYTGLPTEVVQWANSSLA